MSVTNRFALAIEVEVDGVVDPSTLDVAEVRLHRIDGGELPGRALRLIARPFGVGGRLFRSDPRITRAEVHANPADVFAETSSHVRVVR